MRRNFKPHESRGLSSVWNPGNPQPSSDAPTSRPASSAVPQTSFIEAQEDATGTRNMSVLHESHIPRPSTAIPPTASAPRFHNQRQHQFAQPAQPAQPAQSNPSFHTPYTPWNPPPSLNQQPAPFPPSIGKFQNPSSAGNPSIALQNPPSNYQWQSGTHLDNPIEFGVPSSAPHFAKQDEETRIELDRKHTSRIREVYAALRLAGVTVPQDTAITLTSQGLFTAIEYFFTQVSPLPVDYVRSADGVVMLLRFLEYGDEKLEIDHFALRMPQWRSTWPAIVDVLYWLHTLTKNLPPPPSFRVGDDEQSVDEVEREKSAARYLLSSVNNGDVAVQEYLEIAEVTGFLLCDTLKPESATDNDNDNDDVDDVDMETHDQSHDVGVEEVPEEYIAEVRNTIKKYEEQTEALLKSQEQALDDCDHEIFRTTQKFEGLTALVKSSETNQKKMRELDDEIARASSELGEQTKRVNALQFTVDTLTADTETATSELQKVFAKFSESTVSLNGVLSLEEAVKLSRKCKELETEHSELADLVQKLRGEAAAAERPVRPLITAVRATAKEYNDETERELQIVTTQLDSVDTLLHSDHLPTSLFTGDGTDLARSKQTWRNRAAEEERIKQQLQESVDEMTRETEATESRLKDSETRSREILDAISQLERERNAAVTSISRREQLDHRMQEHAKERRDLLARLTKSINSLEEQHTKLEQQQSELSKSVQSKLETKQKYALMLLEHQTAYNMLEHKIRQYERANEGLVQAKLDIEQRIRELKPPNRPEFGTDKLTTRERALSLLNSS